ncbi:MAG: hypothetical protein ABSA33_03500, partial [Candidatus Micrarchaeaceae archaeon]
QQVAYIIIIYKRPKFGIYQNSLSSQLPQIIARITIKIDPTNPTNPTQEKAGYVHSPQTEYIQQPVEVLFYPRRKVMPIG